MRAGWPAGRLSAALAAAMSVVASDTLKVDKVVCCADEKRKRKAATISIIIAPVGDADPRRRERRCAFRGTVPIDHLQA